MVLLIFLLVYLNTMRFKGHHFRIESLFSPLVLKAIFCSNPNSICSFSIGQIITLAASKSAQWIYFDITFLKSVACTDQNEQ